MRAREDTRKSRGDKQVAANCARDSRARTYPRHRGKDIGGGPLAARARSPLSRCLLECGRLFPSRLYRPPDRARTHPCLICARAPNCATRTFARVAAAPPPPPRCVSYCRRSTGRRGIGPPRVYFRSGRAFKRNRLRRAGRRIKSREEGSRRVPCSPVSMGASDGSAQVP